MSNFEAFATAFLQGTADKINKRKNDADEYYKEQLKRAQSIADTKLRERMETLESVKMVANNLTSQAGMPEDMVKALANEGPEALENAYKIYQSAAEAGVPLDENFWRDSIKFSGEVKSNDQSVGDFLNSVYGNFSSNIKEASDPNTGKSPFDAFVSSGMGYNAMDKARSRLDSTDIGGMSASNALAMENAPPNTKVLGDTGMTMDLAAIAESERAAKDARQGSDLTLSNVTAFKTLYDSGVADAVTRARVANGGEEITPEERMQIEQEVAEEIFTMAGGDAPELAKRIPSLGKYWTEGEDPAGAPTEPATGPLEGEPYVPPTSFVDPRTGARMSLVGVDPETGKAQYRRPDGSIVKIRLEVLQENDVTEAEEEATGVPPMDNTEYDLGAAFEASPAVDLSQAGVTLPADAVIPEAFNAKGKTYKFNGIQTLNGQDVAIFYTEAGEELVIPIGE